MFPPETWQYEYKAGEQCLDFKNGSKIVLRAFDDPQKVRSTTYDIAYVSQAEEISSLLFDEILGRLRGKVLPKTILIHEGNPAEGYIKDRIIEPEPETLVKKGIFLIGEVRTDENAKHLPDNYITRLLDTYDEAKRARFLYGRWDRLTDRVYSALADHHYIEPIKIHKHYHRAIGLDYGVTSDTAIVYVYKDEHENVIVWDEWKKPKATLEDIYNACHKYGQLPVVADTNIKNNVLRDNQFGSIWGDLSAMGLRLIAAQKGDKNANILLVNQYLHQNRLHFFKHCEYTIKQHKRYQYKRDSEEVVKKDDHSVDALQYVLRYLDKIQVKGPIDVYGPRPRGPTLKDYTVRK